MVGAAAAAGTPLNGQPAGAPRLLGWASVPWAVVRASRRDPPTAMRQGHGWLGRMHGFDLSALVTAVPTPDPTRFILDVPDGLQQGRGAWGGVATGAIISAAQQVEPRPAMAVRTLSAQLVAPVLVGRAQVAAEVLRRGSATTTVAVQVRDGEDGLLAHGVVVLGSPRRGDDMPDGPEWLGVAPPRALAAGPDAAAVVEVGPPLAPEFTVHLEMRPVVGVPFEGSTSDTIGWVRPRQPVSRLDAAVVSALADAWWASVMVRLDRVRPAATVGYALELPLDPASLPRTAEGGLMPLLHRGRVVAARDGFAVETRELWTVDGRLASWNTQTVAVIK